MRSSAPELGVGAGAGTGAEKNACKHQHLPNFPPRPVQPDVNLPATRARYNIVLFDEKECVLPCRGEERDG